MEFVNPITQRQAYFRSPILDWRMPFIRLFLIVFFFLPFAIWLGWTDPSVFADFRQPWPTPWAWWTAVAAVIALLAAPIVWIIKYRTLDLLALNLGLNALLIAGYFFLGSTAWRIQEASRGILEAGSLAVLINAVGFGCFLTILVVSYTETKLRGARLPALPASPQELDRRLAWFLRLAALATIVVISMPMAVSGVIPLLAADPVQARIDMIRSDTARALYHAGSAVLPFITGGLIVLIARKPLRALGPDGWISGGIVAIQLLTSNRLPLAITLFVTATLLTIERKFSRTVVVTLFAGFLFLYAGLSGLTAIYRQEKELLGKGNIIVTSVQQAFLGDNLIDLRDAAWVFSRWDFEPLGGRTYLGGLASFLPSGVFPQKKEWHLGLTGLRIVGWDTAEHFGLRITFFGEAFLNFGPAGVVLLGIMMGGMYGPLLRRLHLTAQKRPSCLHCNLRIILLMQIFLPLSNTSDGYMFWATAVFLILNWLMIDFPLMLRPHEAPIPLYAPSRA